MCIGLSFTERYAVGNVFIAKVSGGGGARTVPLNRELNVKSG